jgi:hypothetical protein
MYEETTSKGVYRIYRPRSNIPEMRRNRSSQRLSSPGIYARFVGVRCTPSKTLRISGQRLAAGNSADRVDHQPRHLIAPRAGGRASPSSSAVRNKDVGPVGATHTSRSEAARGSWAACSTLRMQAFAVCSG